MRVDLLFLFTGVHIVFYCIALSVVTYLHTVAICKLVLLPSRKRVGLRFLFGCPGGPVARARVRCSTGMWNPS